jgi:hypothetical protein
LIVLSESREPSNYYPIYATGDILHEYGKLATREYGVKAHAPNPPTLINFIEDFMNTPHHAQLPGILQSGSQRVENPERQSRN